ncbi:hypothetical protein K431DRAFT_311602 [Polychaeton citri CBS 116435]|uniref:BTB domain-containing protein n=1 Tax=Polychaeton citri CBS 116435 TaxID=1314669 RepID=A0A9P4QBD3_9PEZI|nr:hypothetical protein K431DRAFT_311602 [Polychaeton citri CBS 116435]
MSPAKRKTGKLKHPSSGSKDASRPPVGKVRGKRGAKKRMTLRSTIDRSRDLGTHVLFLFIGPTRELSTIHSRLLPAPTIDYIEREGNFHGVYWLPNLDPDIFQLYRICKYQNRFFSKKNDDKLAADDQDEEVFHDGEWRRLIDMYLLGAELRDECFANLATDAILEKVEMGKPVRYPTSFAEYVYAETKVGDPLRKLLVDLHIWIGEGTGIEHPHDDADGPPAFTDAVTTGIAKLLDVEFNVDQEEVNRPWDMDQCLYHSHEITPGCST